VLCKVTLDKEDWLEALLTVGFLKGSTIRLRYCDLSRTIRSSFLTVGSDKWNDEIVATKAEVVQAPQEPIVDVLGPMTQAGIVHAPQEQIVDVPVPDPRQELERPRGSMPVPLGKEILQTQESEAQSAAVDSMSINWLKKAPSVPAGKEIHWLKKAPSVTVEEILLGSGCTNAAREPPVGKEVIQSQESVTHAAPSYEHQPDQIQNQRKEDGQETLILGNILGPYWNQRIVQNAGDGDDDGGSAKCRRVEPVDAPVPEDEKIVNQHSVSHDRIQVKQRQHNVSHDRIQVKQRVKAIEEIIEAPMVGQTLQGNQHRTKHPLPSIHEQAHPEVHETPRPNWFEMSRGSDSEDAIEAGAVSLSRSIWLSECCEALHNPLWKACWMLD